MKFIVSIESDWERVDRSIIVSLVDIFPFNLTDQKKRVEGQQTVFRVAKLIKEELIKLPSGWYMSYRNDGLTHDISYDDSLSIMEKYVAELDRSIHEQYRQIQDDAKKFAILNEKLGETEEGGKNGSSGR